MPLTPVQNLLLVAVLPAVLFPLLLALAAGLGIARWRRILIALSIAGLALFVVGAVVVYLMVTAGVTVRVPTTGPPALVTFFETMATPAIFCGSDCSGVGEFLALVLSARSRCWDWFGVLLAAAVIRPLATSLAISPFALIAFIPDSTRAMELFNAPGYRIATAGVAGLAMMVLVLYALFGTQSIAQRTMEDASHL